MRRVLGRGLAQLLGEQEESSSAKLVRVDALVPNSRQPRKSFQDESLSELADSIRRVGIMQPIIVRPLDDHRFEIIAGERRWRAAKLAGLEEAPVIVRSADAREALQLALIENIQREDISSLEAAEAYQSLVVEHGLTQEEVAERVGKSRSAIANTLRLLRLPTVIRQSLAQSEITEGHARALLQFDTEAEQLLAHQRVLDKGLSVRQTELLAKKPIVQPRKAETINQHAPSSIELALSEYFGSPVRLSKQGKRGNISIEYFSDDDLSRILEKLGIRL